MVKKNKFEFEKKQINSAYRLMQKIIRTKILSEKEAVHLAIIFTLARPLHKENNLELDWKSSLLIDYIDKIYK